jgi:hypothetical protein
VPMIVEESAPCKSRLDKSLYVDVLGRCLCFRHGVVAQNEVGKDLFGKGTWHALARMRSL